MARIDSYTTVTPTPDDYLLGTDDPAGAAPTRNFTVQSIIDLTSQNLGDTNDYLDAITVESGYAADASDAATITFSVGDQTDVTLNLGGAAFKAANHYATSTALTAHIDDTTNPHSLDSIVGNQTLAPTKLKGITANGSSGQVLTSDGAGNFAWADDQDDNDNNYLSAVSKPSGSSNDVLFTISGNGGANVTATIFGDGAFMSKSDIRTEVKNNLTYTVNDFTFLGDVASVDQITNNLIAENAVTNSKILNSTISESKLNISNDPVDGYVLTADGADGAMSWEANSASNYYLNDISKSGNTLIFDVTGISSDDDPTYTFGDGAFALFAGSGDLFGTGDTIARGDHNHSISSLDGAGGLASKSSVNTSEIIDKAVTAGKLSPTTAGTDGQVLSLNSSNELVWVNSSGTAIADVRLLPSTIGATNSDNDGYGSQVLRVNSAGTLVEYVDLAVDKEELSTTNDPAAGKILGLNSNNDLEWVGAPTPTIVADSIDATKIDFIDDGLSAATAGHILISDGTDFGNVAMSGDATITSSGVISIEDGSITPDMRANSFFTKIPGDSWQSADGNWVTDAPYQKFTVDPTTGTSFNLPPLTSSETNPLVIVTNGEYGIPYRFQINVNAGSTNITFAFEVPSAEANYTTYYKNGFGIDEYNDANPSNYTPAYIEVIFYKADIDLGGSDFYSTAEIISFNQPSILDDAVTPAKISVFEDNMTSTTAGHILVSDGAEFDNVEMSGVIAITSAGATSFNSTVAGDGITNTSGVLSADVDDSTIELSASNGTGELRIKDNGITHAKLENRYTAEGSLTTNAAITVNCSLAVNYKMSADLSAETTFTLTNYKVGHCITIWNIKGNQTVNLTAGTGTPVFNKVGGVDYEDNDTDYNVMQIECVDDDAANPVFFYSLQTYASDKDNI